MAPFLFGVPVKAYTVLLSYPASHDTYLAHVDAYNPREAGAEAKAQCIEANTGCGSWNHAGLTVLAVFEGHLIDYSSEAA
jgi:hypothetical protein